MTTSHTGPEQGFRRRLGDVLHTLRNDSDPGLRSDAPAVLARWRRTLGRSPDDVPELSMEIARVIGDPGSDISPRLIRAWEDATHYALGLFAVHQQSVDTLMHQSSGGGTPGPDRSGSLGAVCRSLARAQLTDVENHEFPPQTPQFEQVNRGIVRRLEAAMGATSTLELVGHLRGIVPFLSARRIPMDYVDFTADLASWSEARRRGRTARRWGRDFYRPVATDSPDTSHP